MPEPRRLWAIVYMQEFTRCVVFYMWFELMCIRATLEAHERRVFGWEEEGMADE